METHPVKARTATVTLSRSPRSGERKESRHLTSTRYRRPSRERRAARQHRDLCPEKLTAKAVAKDRVGIAEIRCCGVAQGDGERPDRRSSRVASVRRVIERDVLRAIHGRHPLMVSGGARRGAIYID